MRGSRDAEYVARMGVRLPYFRMREMEMSLVSTSTRGPSRTGLDCEAVLRLTPPADISPRVITIVHFNYVIVPKGGEEFELDMY